MPHNLVIKDIYIFFSSQTNLSCFLIASTFAWYSVSAGNFEPSVNFSSAHECSMRHTLKGSADFSPRVSQESSPLITLTSWLLINYWRKASWPNSNNNNKKKFSFEDIVSEWPTPAPAAAARWNPISDSWTTAVIQDSRSCSATRNYTQIRFSWMLFWTANQRTWRITTVY